MTNPLTRLRNVVRALRGRMHNRSEEMRRRPWRHDPAIRQHIIDQFHGLYYDGYAQGMTWSNTYWRGVKTEKCPLDLWIYQEIILDLKPDIVVETGTRFGGSALFMADICALAGKGRIITVDIEDVPGRPTHDRITYVRGSSVSDESVATVRAGIRPDDIVMVVLDSDHRKAHVREELRVYSPFVTRGSYLIVEDTNVNGHPVAGDFGPGPMEALDDFLASSTGFRVDASKEKFYLTFSPRGYLRRD